MNLPAQEGKHFLAAISALERFLKINGYEVHIDRDLIKKHLKKEEEKIDIFDYERDEDLVSEALEGINKIKSEYCKFFVIVLFFSGLRIPEVVFLFKNWNRLKKRYFGDVCVVKLNYFRNSKRAYLTMLPTKLAVKIKRTEYGENIGNYIRRKYKIRLSVYRKAHTAILSETMKDYEIDLLQGRLSKTLVKHYIRHLKKISKKYWKAYEPFTTVISTLLQ